MKLVYKRILIIFSVALNIGFLIMAGSMFFNYNRNSHEISEIEEIVHSLNLTEAQEDKVMDSVHKLKSAIERQEAKINLARTNILTMASKPGPLDEPRLQKMIDTLNREEINKNSLFNTHVTELRTILGDEKGAEFYSSILEHTKNRAKPHNR